MNIDLDIQYIDRDHRVGRPNSAVFEDLTRNRSEIAYHARQLKKSQDIKVTWTSDGKIFIKHFNDKISVCMQMHDLPKVSPTTTNRKTYAIAAREPVEHSV